MWSIDIAAYKFIRAEILPILNQSCHVASIIFHENYNGQAISVVFKNFKYIKLRNLKDGLNYKQEDNK